MLPKTPCFIKKAIVAESNYRTVAEWQVGKIKWVTIMFQNNRYVLIRTDDSYLQSKSQYHESLKIKIDNINTYGWQVAPEGASYLGSAHIELKFLK